MIQLDLNMKMPDKCSACKFFRVESQMYCTAVVGYTTVSKPHERKPAWCPLHEITDPDTVRRQAALDAVEKCHTQCCRQDSTGDEWVHYETILNEMECLPPSPSRPHGKWLPEYGNPSARAHYCSVCKFYYTTYPEEMNYCPHCGAKMEQK